VLAAGSEQDIAQNIVPFERAHAAFKKAVEDGLARGISGDNYVVRQRANLPWVELMDKGYKIADGILGTREIPARKAKGLEMAYRLYARSRKMPKNVYKWWKTNEKRILLTIAAAKTWPEKQEGTDALFRLGPFTVHNTTGASGAKLEAFKKMLVTATNKVKADKDVPGLRKVLYGDIYLAGQLNKARTAAWYNIQEDVVYCRVANAKWGFDESFALVHELTHRYWRKFMSREAKALWEKHHRKTSYKKVEIPPPEVGEALPVRIKGAPRGWRPVIKEIKESAYTFARPDGSESEISKYRLLKFRRETMGDELRFPTAYSAKNAEEHFCEAVASDAFGSLGPEHTAALRSIF
jgi:hypothetical protein